MALSNGSPSPLADVSASHPQVLVANALELGPCKQMCLQDKLVHKGRHFGRTIHSFCRIHIVIDNGIIHQATVITSGSEEHLSFQDRFEYGIYKKLLALDDRMEDRILASDEQRLHVSDMLQKGANGARADDTKGLKGDILTWILANGQFLDPPLSRNIKSDHGFYHDDTGRLLCPTGLNWNDPNIHQQLRSGEMMVPGDEWPIFVYEGYVYDPEDPWKGLFRSALLVKVYKHVFTSPSSVEKENKATRSGNAWLHSMTAATPASIAYIATQVRFALSSAGAFSRNDKSTDSERFYTTVLGALHDPDDVEEIHHLMQWWDQQVFPGYSSIASRSMNINNALARIKVKRAERKLAAAAASASNPS